MTNIAKTLYSFFNGFGLDAYVEGTIPDDATLPYITYRLIEPDWLNPVSIYARVWYRSTSFDELTAKVDEIGSAIGTGKTIPFDGGFVTLLKDSNFAQYMPESLDGTIKTAYLSLIMHAMEV